MTSFAVVDPSLPAPPPAACRCTRAFHDDFELVTLRSPAGLEASFAPEVGMACCSLRHGGTELLAERHGLTAYADCGITMGLSLMHPWTNRLSGWSYTALGTTVRLPVSPLLHTDRWGLPVNGVQSSGHIWIVESRGADDRAAWLEATLPFDRNPRQLALFPFPHRVHLRAEVAGRTLLISTEIEATGDAPVPICFGYRLYLRRDVPAAGAEIVLPARRRIMTDERLLPTGAAELRRLQTRELASTDVREVFVFGLDRRLRVDAGARRLTLESVAGFPLAQVRAVPEEPHVMLEALTTEPDALRRHAYPVAMPGQPYRAALRIAVDDAPIDGDPAPIDRARLAA